MKKKNILIISRCVTDNIGDLAISRAMKSLVEELTSANVYAADLRCEKLISNPFLRLKHKLYNLIARMGAREFAWKVENRGLFDVLNKVSFDLVLIGGGELVQSNGIFPMALDTWAKLITRKQPKAKIYLFGVGVTSHFSEKDRTHICQMLQSISGAVVRDQASKENLFNLFGIKSTVIPDVVYSLKILENKVNNLELDVRNGVLYGLTNYERIMKYGLYAHSREAYFQKTLDAISTFGGKVKLFYTTNDDFKECLRFQSYAKSKSVSIEIAEYCDLDSLFTLLKSKETVISPRMHGCILADLCGCKTEPILISPKMMSYKASYQKPLDIVGMRTRIVEEMRQIIER